jgi:hypothetical protein
MIPKSCRLFGKDYAASKIPKVADFLVKITRQKKNMKTMCDQGLVHNCAAAGNLGLDRQPHSRLPGSMRERMIQKQLPTFG